MDIETVSKFLLLKWPNSVLEDNIKENVLNNNVSQCTIPF